MNNSGMHPPLFLTPDEIATLTGFKLASRQIDWLRNKGWRFTINGNCHPVVARKYAEKMLGCGDDEGIGHASPNFAALKVA